MVVRRGAGRLDGGEDAAARLRRVLVRRASEAHCELAGAVPCEQQVRVRVDESRGHQRSAGVDLLGARVARQLAARNLLRQLVVGPNERDLVTFHRDGAVLDDRERPLARCGLRTVHRRKACVPDREVDHGVSPGMCTPRSRATWMASSYPASACRRMPMAGSLVRTRSSRRAAASVPSATMT